VSQDDDALAGAVRRHRVTGDAVEIDYAATLDFFEGRAARAARPDALTTVLYQDAHPEVARARHEFEVERVVPRLRLDERPRVLDVGCGNGRWARTLSGSVRGYLGVDFSPGLVALARESVRTLPDASRFRFQVLSAARLADDPLDVAPPFQLVVMAGVLIYLNDDDVERTIGALPGLVDDRAVVYLREPTAVAQRLTLDRFPSTELDAPYTAVYRTATQYRELLAAALGSAGFSFAVDEPMSSSLRNRSETSQHYFVLTRS
jgi:SAM-dependent methyltransferase